MAMSRIFPQSICFSGDISSSFTGSGRTGPLGLHQPGLHKTFESFTKYSNRDEAGIGLLGDFYGAWIALIFRSLLIVRQNLNDLFITMDSICFLDT